MERCMRSKTAHGKDNTVWRWIKFTLYTTPKLPSPILFLSEKSSVAFRSWLKVNIVGLISFSAKSAEHVEVLSLQKWFSEGELSFRSIPLSWAILLHVYWEANLPRAGPKLRFYNSSNDKRDHCMNSIKCNPRHGS